MRVEDLDTADCASDLHRLDGCRRLGWILQDTKQSVFEHVPCLWGGLKLVRDWAHCLPARTVYSSHGSLFFGWRFSKGRKFVPGGLMGILSAVTLVLRHVH
jgi:hypothetical protein